MKYIPGQNRNQVAFITQSLDETIGQDNEVRLIDIYRLQSAQNYEYYWYKST